MTLKRRKVCYMSRLAERSEKFGVKSWRGWLCVPLPSSSSCRFARSLKSFQPTNPAPHSTRRRASISTEKNVSPTTRASGDGGWWWLEKTGEEKKKMMAPGMRMGKNHASNDRKPRAVCFFTANRRSHGHCHPLFKDFPAFFSRSICHSYVLIVIRAKISLIRFLPLFLFFLFSYIGFGWIITMFFFSERYCRDHISS